MISGSDDCIVRNNYFEHNIRGMTAWNSPNVLITNNTFHRQLHTSITLQGASGFDLQNSVAEKNTITNTALYPVYGVRTDGVYQGIGINVAGTAYTVRQNRVENSSHAGIVVTGDGKHLIENNVVRNAMLLLNDGGAIVLGSDGNQLRGNFFLNSFGNVDDGSNGCGSLNQEPCSHHSTYGMGIGANNNLKDNVIEGNTVANNAHQGIRLNAFLNTSVRNNVVYNNDRNQIVIEDKKGPSRNNVIEDNIVFALTPEQKGMELTNTTNHGTFSNNFYCNPFSDIILVKDKNQYALKHWQAKFPSDDQNSQWCEFNFGEYHAYNVSSAEASLIVNSTFETTVENWNGSGSAEISYDATQAQMDGGSLKAVYSGSKNANVIPKSFGLVAGKMYRLQFNVIGNGFGTIQLRINDTNAQEDAILKESYFAYDQTRKDYELFFESETNTQRRKSFSSPLKRMPTLTG
ncbi:cell surface protein [Beggiatoa sp. PS]|nr:cell surface protein [Beggiatoa sp. PS]